MKRLLLLTLSIAFVFLANAQKDKKPVSPLVTLKGSSKGGAGITIIYSQPSVKGRTIGKNLEPLEDTVWRAGANKATVFEVSKNVTIDGKALSAGKYSFFILTKGDDWTLIFNKTWDQWGAYKYKEADDVLRVPVKRGKAPAFSEKLTYAIATGGMVSILWGDNAVNFTVE